MNFFEKYLKYKDKYITLKNQSGGGWGAPRPSTRIVIMNDANQFLTCQNGRNHYSDLTGGNSFGLVRGKTVQQLINFLIANGLTNPNCDLNAMFNAEINAGTTIVVAAQQHAAAPIALAPVAGGANACVPAPITNSGRNCGICTYDGPIENWFRQKLLPYLNPVFKYMIIGEIQLKIFSTAPNSGNIILIGGQKEGTLTLVQNIIKETCEELFYHIPVAQQNIDPANGEPRQLVAGGVANNTLYTLGTVGIDTIYFYKVSNDDGIRIKDYARLHLDKSEIINLDFRNRAAITSLDIRNLLNTFGLG